MFTALWILNLSKTQIMKSCCCWGQTQNMMIAYKDQSINFSPFSVPPSLPPKVWFVDSACYPYSKSHSVKNKIFFFAIKIRYEWTCTLFAFACSEICAEVPIRKYTMNGKAFFLGVHQSRQHSDVMVFRFRFSLTARQTSIIHKKELHSLWSTSWNTGLCVALHV